MPAHDVPKTDAPRGRARIEEATEARDAPGRASVGRYLLRCTVLALAYVLAGKVGLQLATVHPSASAIWPPTGIAIAALLLLGPSVWPAVFLGAMVVNATGSATFANSLGIACGNTLEGVAGALLVRRFAGGREAFDRAVHVFAFAACTGASALISATIGVSTLAIDGHVLAEDYGAVWITWWLGDAISAWVFTPFLLSWTETRRSWREVRLAELALLLGVLVGVGQLVFFVRPIMAGTRANPLTFLCLPPLVWAAFRFPRRIVTTATLFLSVLAVLGTLEGTGVFTSENENQSLLFLQSFLGVVSVTALAVRATVSETKRSERDLRARSTELRRSNEQLEQFAAVASHDLQEPLRMVTSYIQLLKKRCGDLSPGAEVCVQHALDATQRMRELIDGLLDYARLDSAGSSFVAVDCERVLDRALANLAVALEESMATLARGGMPSVRGDELQLVQLFQNLIGNALKFRSLDRQLHVRIDSRMENGEWVFSVEDNGIGIEPGSFERIFLIFQRLHHREEYPGTGLGLAICKRIVERHGGRIWVDSAPTLGSTFFFTLPIQEKAARPSDD